MSAEQNINAQWWLKTADGTRYGPVGLPTLCAWAADARVAPGCVVSPDGERWTAAHELAPLRMDWFVELGDGTEYGPLNLLAVADLVREGSVRVGARLRHARKPGERAVDHRFSVWVLEESRAMLAAVVGMAEEPAGKREAEEQDFAARVAETEKQCRELEAALEEARRKIASLERADAGRLADLHRRLAEAEKQADLLSSLLDKERAEGVAAGEEVRRLKLALIQAEDRLKERRDLEGGDRRRLEEERDRLARARDEALREAEAARSRLRERSRVLETALQEREEQLGVAAERASAAERRLAEATEEARMGRAAAEEKAARLADAGRRLAEAVKQAEALSGLLEKERARAAALEAEINGLKQALAQIEQRQREEQGEHNEREAQHRRLEEERDRLARARDEALREAATARAQAVERSRELEKALKQKEEQLREAVARLAVAEAAPAQVTEAAVRLEELERRLAESDNQLKALAERLESERKQAAWAEAESRRLKQALAEAEKRRPEPTGAAGDKAAVRREDDRRLEEERDRLAEDVRNLTARLEAAEAARDRALAAGAEAERAAHDLAERIRQLEAARATEESAWKTESRRLEEALQSVREEWARAENRLAEEQKTTAQLRGAMAVGEQDLHARMNRMRDEFAAIVAGLEQAARHSAAPRRAETMDAVEWLDGGRRARAPEAPTGTLDGTEALAQRVEGLAEEMRLALETAQRAQQDLGEYQARYQTLEARYQDAMRANEEQTARLRAEIQVSADLLAQAMGELERRESEYRALRKRLEERADPGAEVVSGPWEKPGARSAPEGPTVRDKLKNVEAQAQAELEAWQRRQQGEPKEGGRKWFPRRTTGA